MNAIDTGLALPMIGMLALTLLVWIALFVQRVGFVNANKLHIEDMKTPRDVESMIPGESSSASYNFKNLFEMPVVFYAVCLYLTVFGMVDEFHVYCAWLFMIFRVVHSLIHCTYNKVTQRFLAYLISSVAVWIMVARGLLATL
tara:strand:- start:207569 stop:207997 length:429 start_codon:yes stop_codon:yes gene_type:complete